MHKAQNRTVKGTQYSTNLIEKIVIARKMDVMIKIKREKFLESN